MVYPLHPPSRLRTRNDYVRAAKKVEAARLKGISKGSEHDPTKKNGINGDSELSRLQYFDVTICVCLDGMHILSGIISRLIKLLNGQTVTTTTLASADQQIRTSLQKWKATNEHKAYVDAMIESTKSPQDFCLSNKPLFTQCGNI